MARDKTLEQRMESILHSCAVPHSGKVAAVVIEAFQAEMEDARAELTLALGLIASGKNPSRSIVAKGRINNALDALGGPLERKANGD